MASEHEEEDLINKTLEAFQESTGRPAGEDQAHQIADIVHHYLEDDDDS